MQSFECKDRVWCYTEDEKTEWDFCNVPFCNEHNHESGAECEKKIDNRSADDSGTTTTTVCQITQLHGMEYKGDISAAQSGRKCKKWSLLSEFPSIEHNHCRTFDNSKDQVWCFIKVGGKTGLQTKEVCLVPFCSKKQEKKYFSFFGPGSFDCQAIAFGGSNHFGTINRAAHGKICKNWNSMEKDGWEHNNCRAKGSKGRVWCYTGDKKTEWDFCDVPFCNIKIPEPDPKELGTECEKKGAMEGSDYRRTQSRTISGNTCQSWFSRTPHKHGELNGNIIEYGIGNHNFCRK